MDQFPPSSICFPETKVIRPGISELGARVADENRTKLGELIGTVGARLLYEYDFGDGWQRELLLEEILLGDETFRRHALRVNMLSARRLWRAARICRASPSTPGS